MAKRLDPRDYLNSPRGCLSCFHSRMTGKTTWKCVLGHPVKAGRLCGSFEAANGRMTG